MNLEAARRLELTLAVKVRWESIRPLNEELNDPDVVITHDAKFDAQITVLAQKP